MTDDRTPPETEGFGVSRGLSCAGTGETSGSGCGLPTGWRTRPEHLGCARVPRGHGGIGIRAGFRFQCRKACGFESHCPHHHLSWPLPVRNRAWRHRRSMPDLAIVVHRFQTIILPIAVPRSSCSTESAVVPSLRDPGNAGMLVAAADGSWRPGPSAVPPGSVRMPVAWFASRSSWSPSLSRDVECRRPRGTNPPTLMSGPGKRRRIMASARRETTKPPPSCWC
jgi:hypothetical protein